MNKKRGAFIGNYGLNSGPVGLPPMSSDGEIVGGFDLSFSESNGQNTNQDIEQPSLMPETENIFGSLSLVLHLFSNLVVEL